MTTAELTALDRRLLNAIQMEFPVVPRPYAAIGERLGIGEAEVLQRIAALRQALIVRQIGAIYDTRKLGYRGMLVAMRAAPDRLDEVAGHVCRHPGVSHNYGRDHLYNLWFTIAAPPGRNVEDHVKALARHPAVEDALMLPTLKLYKIGVKLDMTGESDPTAEDAPAENVNADMKSADIDEECKAVVRETQEDLPGEPAPFAPMAKRLGMTEEALFAKMTQYRERGILRRYAAVLRHQKAGFGVNVMAVWVVPEARIDELGPKMAGVRAVSHCYRRPTFPNWPYNVFTMIHARSAEEAEKVVAAIRDTVQTDAYARLVTTKEYKKVRLKYFTPDIEAWEAQHLA